MRLRFVVAAIGLFCASIFLIGAKPVQAEGEKYAFGHRMTPCSSWRYDFNTNTYTCSYTDMQISVPDLQEHRDLENIVDRLSQQIEALGQRVQALENNP